MSRRKNGASMKHAHEIDPKYGSELVSHMINHFIRKGKKTTARRIVYGALEELEGKVEGKEILEVLDSAVNNMKPRVEVKSRRVGGANFQVPMEVRPERKISLSMKNMIVFARKRSGHSMAEKLAAEIMAAYNNEGAAFKRKEDMHRMAEANKAFAHFRF